LSGLRPYEEYARLPQFTNKNWHDKAVLPDRDHSATSGDFCHYQETGQSAMTSA